MLTDDGSSSTRLMTIVPRLSQVSCRPFAQCRSSYSPFPETELCGEVIEVASKEVLSAGCPRWMVVTKE